MNFGKEINCGTEKGSLNSESCRGRSDRWCVVVRQSRPDNVQSVRGREPRRQHVRRPLHGRRQAPQHRPLAPLRRPAVLALPACLLLRARCTCRRLTAQSADRGSSLTERSTMCAHSVRHVQRDLRLYVELELRAVHTHAPRCCATLRCAMRCCARDGNSIYFIRSTCCVLLRHPV